MRAEIEIARFINENEKRLAMYPASHERSLQRDGFPKPSQFSHSTKGHPILSGPKLLQILVAGGGFEPPTFGL